MITVGIIGYGYWGPNLLRNFWNTADCRVVAVADSRAERLALVRKNYPVPVTTNPDDILTSTEIDAVVIATPVSTHFAFARKALENGKHVLLEKPMAGSLAHASELIELANAKSRVLMVDHTFLYTSAVGKIRELMNAGELGELKYFDSTRINLGLFQPDVNVIWDLATHDIAILNYLVSEKPYSVHATGISHTGNNIENIGYLTVNYQSGFIAHFSCSWASPVKVRTILIGGDRKMVVYNDIEPSEKIRIYDSGYIHKTDEDKSKVLVDYRTGDIFIPKLENREALSAMAADFISAVSEGTIPKGNAESGLEVIRILEASEMSIKNRGKEIIL